MSTPRIAHPSEPRPSRRVGDDVGDSKDGVSARATEIFTWGVLSVCLAVWAIVGFFLWIPRLLRTMTLFSMALIQSTVMDADSEEAALALRSAASFYWRGFAGAITAVRTTRGEDAPGRWGLRRDLFTRELAWAVVIWYVLLWWVGVVAWTPADLWRGILDIPWAEMGALIVGYFEALPGLFTS